MITLTSKKQTYQFGILAEKIAMIFLRLKLYEIIAWRHKNYFGEIDIIAKKSNTIIAIEVKARKKETLVEEVLRPAQIKRIKKSTEFFISKNYKYRNYNLRFDFIEVRGLFAIKHHKNFF
jgi:putative endonuclease